MCAKVKAEVQNIAGELVVSGLDSATSLIQVKIFYKNCNLFIYSCGLGGEKFNECCCANCQSLLCCFDEVQDEANGQ